MVSRGSGETGCFADTRSLRSRKRHGCRVYDPAVTTTATVSDDIVQRAKSGDRRAIEAVFRDVYPVAHRVARAICGEPDRAGRVVDVTFRQALHILPRWSAGTDPANWFTHHVVQTSRQVRGGGRPASDVDLLVAAAPEPQRTPAYAAFVRGVRRLPPQQAEAFLLHHGERLNARLLGVAMDCSTQAAETHLRAADAAVRDLAGPAFDALAEQLRRAVVALSPTDDEADRFARTRVGAWAGRRLRRRFGRVLVTALLAGAAYVAWQNRDRIRDRFLPAANPAPATQPARNP